MKDDNATAGGVFGFLLLVAIVGAFVVFLGPVVDNLNHVHTTMANTPGLPMSQERVTTMNLLTFGFGVIAIAVLIAGGINLWINSIRQQDQDV